MEIASFLMLCLFCHPFVPVKAFDVCPFSSASNCSLSIFSFSSLGSSFSVPIGGIIAYTGSLNALPLNYHLCDGTDGTPDLRDRFIVGAGSSYNLNTIGGTSTNILALNQLPNLADFLNKTIAVQGNNQVNGSNNLVSNLPIRAWSWEYFQKNEGNTHGYFKNAFATIPGTSNSFGQPIENKPPYMALYWVMRIK